MDHTCTPAPFFLGRPGRAARAFERRLYKPHPLLTGGLSVRATEPIVVDPHDAWSTIVSRLGGRVFPLGQAFYKPIDPLHSQPAGPIPNPEETNR